MKIRYTCLQSPEFSLLHQTMSLSHHWDFLAHIPGIDAPQLAHLKLHYIPSSLRIRSPTRNEHALHTVQLLLPAHLPTCLASHLSLLPLFHLPPYHKQTGLDCARSGTKSVTSSSSTHVNSAGREMDAHSCTRHLAISSPSLDHMTQTDAILGKVAINIITPCVPHLWIDRNALTVNADEFTCKAQGVTHLDSMKMRPIPQRPTQSIQPHNRLPTVVINWQPNRQRLLLPPVC